MVSPVKALMKDLPREINALSMQISFLCISQENRYRKLLSVTEIAKAIIEFYF